VVSCPPAVLGGQADGHDGRVQSLINLTLHHTVLEQVPFKTGQWINRSGPGLKTL
jgi:hypothetical protein